MLKKIGKYEIVAQIGQGGFGTVYEGHDPLIKRRVAIKTCSTDDDSIRKRFFREAEIAGRLQHRNIVTVFDLGVQDDVPYLVQEFLTGQDLRDKIAHHAQVSDVQKFTYLLQLAEGLRYAHAQGVVHRDIKPANIRILEDDSVKIMDFGIAKLADAVTQLTNTGMAMGTTGYLAPEQIRAEKIDARADMFAFGVVAYELFTGTKPFHGDSIHNIFYKILTQEPEALRNRYPAVTPQLERIIWRCLRKTPDERYPNFAEIIGELKPLVDAVDGTEELTRLASRLENAIEQGEIADAELEITLARKRYGGKPLFARLFDPLLRRIAEIRKQWEENRKRVEELLEKARGLNEEGSYDDALVAANAALEIDAQNEPARAVVRSIEAALERERENEERARLVAEKTALIDDLISGGRLDDASRALSSARVGIGRSSAFAPISARLAEALALRAAAVSDLVGRAEALEREGRDEDARAVFIEAQGIDPGNEQVRAGRARIEAIIKERIEEERRAAALASARREMDGLLLARDVRKSRSALKRYERQFGPEPFREARQRFDAIEREIKASRPKRDVPRQVWVGLGGTGLVGAAAALGFLVLRGPAPNVVESPSSSPATPIPAATPVAGTLALDAAPWAEITDIVDAATNRVIPVGVAKFTPLTLRLPPGEYSITFVNPAFQDPVVKKVRLHPLGSSVFAEFRRVDAGEYLRAAGL